jgi:hypothetical protein
MVGIKPTNTFSRAQCALCVCLSVPEQIKTLILHRNVCSIKWYMMGVVLCMGRSVAATDKLPRESSAQRPLQRTPSKTPLKSDNVDLLNMYFYEDQ